MVLFQKCVWWSRPLTKMAAQLYLVLHRTLWEIHIKTILSGTGSSIRTKLWWNSHLMVLFQNCVQQSCSPTKMAAAVQLRCYWKQLWSRWAITGSWEPLVSFALSIFSDVYWGIKWSVLSPKYKFSEQTMR
jgi:hypothetical protein